MGGGPGKEPLKYRWEEGGFYAVLTARVKTHFLEKNGCEGADPRRASVNRFVKVGWVGGRGCGAVWLPLSFDAGWWWWW